MASLDYDLHKLGWRAFQDLCAVVLQEVLGQTFHTFADSNDAGRDGAFYGQWAVAGSSGAVGVNSGAATVAQCKFGARAGLTLTPSALGAEIAKVGDLHRNGLCDAYVLLTNLAVSGRTESWVIDQARKVGVQDVLVLDGTWICQQISKSGNLRRYVPRVYGLGDLGKILDDRRRRQAESLLARLQDDLATFVPTDAYRRAADAVADHGFVLLLGEPACGKSTIAATLAISALDSWRCGVRRVDSADELLAVWDPDEPNQLFWVDDAFGSIRHDATLTDGWSRRMDQVMTAVHRGARVILTSRDYIYRDARVHLKEYAYPRLREHKVVVDVAELTTAEKRQILYNHLKAGDQTRSVLDRWSPHLREAAATDRFQPESARRLAHRAFTGEASITTREDLVDFFAHPTVLLADVLRQLDDAARAALACVYLSGDELRAPVQLTAALSEAISRLGASPADVLRAFSVADGTFLQQAQDSRGDPVWRFRHPTIREGFAAVVAEDTNAVNIFLDGLEANELVQQLDCGGAAARGTLVRVPSNLYPRVIPRVTLSGHPESGSTWSNPAAWFLRFRCSPEFLQAWATYHVGDLPNLLNFGMYIGAFWQPALLACLHQAGALPEEIRKRAVGKLRGFAFDFDSGWLDHDVRDLFSDEERVALLNEIRTTIIPDLNEHIWNSADGYDRSVEPRERFQSAIEAISTYTNAYADDSETIARLEAGSMYIEAQIADAESDFDPGDIPTPDPLAAPAPSPRFVSTERDEFDDVADDR